MAAENSHEFFLQLHLTERCNLRCAHCYQMGQFPAEMTFEQIKDLVAETADMLEIWSDNYGIEFSRSFNITGGEPFLRKDLGRILEEVGNKGFEVYLLSNGTLIDRQHASMLGQVGIRGVQISVEGPEEVHDRIRGEGSFRASLNGIHNLLDAGLHVSMNVTLSEVNADYFPEIIALAASTGVHKVGFSRLVPSGKGAGLVDKMIERAKLRSVYEAVLSIRQKNVEIVTGDPIAAQMNSDGTGNGSFPTAGCAAGLSGLTVLPDGTITPCRRLFIPLGNVLKDRLREVWATSPVLKDLRDKSKYKGKCGKCGKWTKCRGCRAIAFAWAQSNGGNDFLSEDPQCFIGSNSN